MMATTTMRRTLVLALDALVLAAIGFLVFLAYGSLPNGWYRTVVVAGGSMQPALEPGDIVIVTPAPATLRPGMIVVLKVADRLVTHRIIEVRPDGTLRTQGDANTVPDDFGTQDVAVFGEVAWRVPLPGIGGLLPLRAAGADFHARWVTTQRFTIGSWTIPRDPQAITFAALEDRPLDAPPFDPGAVASSGLPVDLRADGACRITDGLVETTAAGDCSITAAQPGDDRWAAADEVTRAFRALRLDARLRFDLSELPTVTMGDPDVSVAATASSRSSSAVHFDLSDGSTGCAVTPDGIVSVLAPAVGDAACVIAASVAADDHYRADGPITQRLTIRPLAPRTQTITFPTLPDATYGDGPIDPGAFATSGLPVRLTASGPCRVVDGQIRIVGAGACDVVAEQDGTADWLPAAPVRQMLDIAPAPLVVRAPHLTVVLGAAMPDLVPTDDGLVGDDRAADLAPPSVCTMEGDVSAVGSHAVTCTRSESANYAIRVVPGEVRVVFAPAGACIVGPGRRILPPVNADGTSVFRHGSTVPVKLRVCDATGRSVGAPGTVVGIRLVAIVTGTVVHQVNEQVCTTAPFAEFRWSPHDQLWILDLAAGGLRPGRTYRYQVDLADGTALSFQFGIR